MNIINFDYEKDYRFEFDEKRLAKIILAEVLLIEKLKTDFSINVSIVSKKTIKCINKKARSINRITDVLSFPSIDFTKHRKFKKIIATISAKDIVKIRSGGESNNIHYTNKDRMNLLSSIDMSNYTYFLGDVVICYDKVLEQANKYNHSIKREYSFLLTHSLLHLLGYDHLSDNDEKKMFKKQDFILSEININR